MSRTKKVLAGPMSRAEAEDAYADFAIADARMAKINADLDVKITKLREAVSEDLAEHDAIKQEKFEALQVWAEGNRDEFGNKKSLDFVHGVLGFRTGTPKLALSKGFTWPSVTNLLKEFLPTYVRVVEEPAKDRLLADRDDAEVSAKFLKVGVVIKQDETFYVEPKKEA